ncbi:RHS repeat-associated core domain-containing protein [Kitasatospora sp. NPDC093806]|uniref:RHS repeat-associated core domain-containing protein n=1 Tax=Kitasatospora sp. NPDC093806 TaxID=3155075 RepID=UPI003420D7EB
MGSPPSFFSQAGNFGSAVAGGVDPRTGLFNVRISLGNLVGNRNLGPSLPLVLGYSPLNGTDAGLGRGVSLGLTTYDRDNRLLALATGEQYKVQETDSKVVLTQKKLDTVRVAKDRDAYRLVHKSGDVEVLTGPRTGPALKVPTALLTPAGHGLSLSWDFRGGPVPRLSSVADADDTLLTVDYTGKTKATLTVLPGRSEGYRVELRFQNNLLTSVYHYGLGAGSPLVWTFSSEPIGRQGVWGSWITGVTMPGGMSETVTYAQGGTGHRFPDSAGLPALPYVTRHVRKPGGGRPQTEVTYAYTDDNFLGGNSGAAWNSDLDNLYGILTGYTYGSTESVTTGGRTTRTTRTYDSYHLQTDETTTRNGCSRQVSTEYYAVVGRRFEQQDDRFQLPKTRTVTWTGPDGRSRDEVTRTEFDDAGNPRSRTAPDGTRTDWEFYPAGGSGSDCPPDPNGFTRWPRTVTHTPPATAFDAPALRTSYSYAAHSTPDSRVPTAVLKATERRYADGLLLRREDTSYGTSGPEFGRITGLTEVEYPDGEDGDHYSAGHTFTFRSDGEALVQTHQLTTHDGLTTTRSQRRSRFTGRLWSATDPQGNGVTLTYDGLGRGLTRTTNPGTVYQATETHAHEVGTSAPFVTTSTDPLGNQWRTSRDGAGRPYLGERRPAGGDGAWQVVRRVEYDELGRVTTESVTDQLPGGGTAAALTRTLSYDDWGALSAVGYDDGTGRLTRVDPVALTATVQQLGGGGPVTGTGTTTFDTRGEPVTTERFDLKGASAGRRALEHDGWGRLRRETDELGNTTGYDYDARGRLTRTTLPDGTAVVRGYAPFSADGLATALAVAGNAYGAQEFDGLGRLTRTSSGGRTWSYRYDRDADPLPARVGTPDGQQLGFGYVPELGNALARVQAGPLTQTLGHDPVTGHLTSAREASPDGDVTVTRDYTPAGLPRTETTTRSGESDATTRWTFSPGGLETDCTGPDGTARQTVRDAFGRITGITDPAMGVSVSYDAGGRPISWTARDPRSGYTLTTTLTLDDFGREVARSTRDGLGHTWSLTQEWLDNDLLARRTSGSGATLLRDETFGYDGRNRLTSYGCDGPEPPTDARGNAITAQTFGYDAFGNVTRCRSRYADGSEDTATHLYEDPADPCRLTGVTHTGGGHPPRITLAYDAAGRLTTDRAGRTLGYDPLGRLRSTGPANRYGYDPLNRLLTQRTDGRTSVLHYRGESLAAVTEDGRPARLLRLGSGGYVARTRDGRTRLLGTDGTGTVRLAAGADGQEAYARTAYGERPVDGADSVPGFTGQRSDPVTGWYHLGNGARAYDPVLLRFASPDILSPFGAGGVNPYAYCAGDPVNRVDPSGHLSWMAWLGIGLGVAGLALAVVTGGMAIVAAGGVMAAIGAASATTLVVGALGVASDVTAIVGGALETASPKASAVLGWVSLGTGLAGLGAGGAGLARAATRRAPGFAEEGARALGGQLSADPGLELNLAKTDPGFHGRPVVLPERTPHEFFAVENANGAKVWVSQDPVDGGMVRGIAEDALSRGKTVDILSGTHGGELGERTGAHIEPDFYFEDIGDDARLTKERIRGPKRSRWAKRVNVYNTPYLSSYRIGQILRGDSSHEIIAAFCFSRNDDTVRRFLGLEPTYSYSPFVDHYHTAL